MVNKKELLETKAELEYILNDKDIFPNLRLAAEARLTEIEKELNLNR